MASSEEGGSAWVSRWSALSDDLLDRIVKMLTRPSDYIRFRSVCKSWRSVARPSNLPHRLPLLMLPYDPSSHLRSVFSLSTNKVHTLSIPALVNKVILTASRGWLVVLDVAPADGRLFLFNPVTGAEIELPPTDGFFLRERGLELFEYDRISPWHAFLLSSPDSAQSNCMVVITGYYPPGYHPLRGSEVAFCRLGDESWTLLSTGLYKKPISVAHHEGSLYVINADGQTSVCKLAAPSDPVMMDVIMDAPDTYIDDYFLVSTSTLLLFFSRVQNDFNVILEDFAIFELKPGNPPKWSQVDTIHDNAVFISRGLHQNFSVCATDIHGLREDCIYFSEPFDFSYGQPRRDAQEIVQEVDVLDLKTGVHEHTICVFPGSQRLPKDKFLHPVWVEPSLCKKLEQSPVQEI